MKAVLSRFFSYKVLSAGFLVAGACIGGGILGVPVEAGSLGFYPSAIMLLMSWLFMTLTAFLYGEAALWMKDDNAHLVSIAKHLLGRWGEWITVILYIFMGYASLVAYNSGGSQLIDHLFQGAFSVSLTPIVSSILYAVVFGSVFYFGAKILGAINTLLMVGLIVSYVMMTAMGIEGVKSELLSRSSWTGFYAVVPLMITSFSFQMIVPSIALYLDKDAKDLKYTLIFGATLALIFYLLWIFVVMGTVPNEGKSGLKEALENGQVATVSLRLYAHRNIIAVLGEWFAFFAITTSYLGIGLGLFDFLADLFRVEKKGLGKFILGLLVVLPTLYITMAYPNTFLDALDITGGLGDSILNGIIPVLMVWMGRYVIGYKSELKLMGGKTILSALFICSLLIITSQILKWVL
ncbi:MAG: Tyrosine-specific transport protein [Chlamydiia bacterium]|nr:Tyrosine-specific transport protein [Chlamydiia bacterium]